MRRRAFISLLGGAATWPLGARAQQPAMSVIGYLNGQATAASASLLGAFHRGLAEAGFVEGRNLAMVYRSAEGQLERLPALAAELVRLQVAVIAAVGGDTSVLSAKAATATIPIVFTTGGDPVEIGVVASFNRPGGNITGASFSGSLVATKQVGLLRDIVPGLVTIGLLVHTANPMTPSIAKEVRATGEAAGLKVSVVELSGDSDVDRAFEELAQRSVDGLLVASGAFFSRHLDRLVALAARHKIPAIFTQRDFPAAGALMSYGADNRDAYRQAGVYVGRILNGARPGDLPVMQPTRFELVINMRTVKALGLTVSPGLLAIADEVIE